MPETALQRLAKRREVTMEQLVHQQTTAECLKQQVVQIDQLIEAEHLRIKARKKEFADGSEALRLGYSLQEYREITTRRGPAGIIANGAEPGKVEPAR